MNIHSKGGKKMFNLKGKVGLVTGASRGIGRSIALKLAEAGATICVHYNTNKQEAEITTGQIKKQGGEAFSWSADVSNSHQVKEMIAEIINRYNKIDILVNNAGIWKEAHIDTITDEELEEMLAINVKGVFYCCRCAVPYMKKQKWGRIINISSTAGQRGEPFHSHYAASKGAIISFTKSLAVELAPYNILVNAIAPGWVNTDMSAEALKTEYDEIISEIPLKRVASPDEIAGAAVYLASEEASFTTGEIININGGAVLCG
jgi:3-oxoacyl-[acyl-carrier protein] reductase